MNKLEDICGKLDLELGELDKRKYLNLKLMQLLVNQKMYKDIFNDLIIEELRDNGYSRRSEHTSKRDSIEK